MWDDERIDNFHWMSERDAPAVLDHLKAENAYTAKVLDPHASTIETIFEEIKGRIKETDLSVPVSDGGWSYYSRSVEGLSYPVHCRTPEQNSSPDEQIILDENAEAADSEFFEMGIFDISPNHDLLLWGTDRVGDERYQVEVRDIESGRALETGLADVAAGSAWALDNASFFYVRDDESRRPYQVWHHQIGSDVSTDRLIFEESDKRFFVSVGRDKDDSYIYIGSSSKIADEVWFIPANDPLAPPQVILERSDGVEYSVVHHDGEFVIVSNRDAETFSVYTVPVTDLRPERWTVIVPPDPAVTIKDIDTMADFLVLYERSEAITRLRIRRWSTGTYVTVEQPEPVSTVWPGANVDPNTTKFRYGYTSMTTPVSVFEVDLESGERNLLKQTEVLGSYDSAKYHTERLWAVADDGVRIPISLVARRDRVAEGPALLYVYGAYEASMDPAFSVARLSLLDRGFAFAIAHVRGGGEMGRHWHLDGKYEKKTNTFTDAIACAQTLLDSGTTSSDGLVLRGGSAGGLAVGAIINQAPELFAAAVAEVPFVDTLSTMLDPNLPLTVTEWEEWGNPIESDSIYEVMRSYSPVDNVSPQSYPAVYATGGLNDTRVSYWEPAKWVQLLRQASTSGNPVLLWTEMDAGHVGPSGRYESWRQEAQTLGFIVATIFGQ